MYVSPDQPPLWSCTPPPRGGGFSKAIEKEFFIQRRLRIWDQIHNAGREGWHTAAVRAPNQQARERFSRDRSLRSPCQPSFGPPQDSPTKALDPLLNITAVALGGYHTAFITATLGGCTHSRTPQRNTHLTICCDQCHHPLLCCQIGAVTDNLPNYS